MYFTLETLFLIDRYLLLVLLLLTAAVIILNHKDKILDYFIALFVAGSVSEAIKYFANMPRPDSIFSFEGGGFPSTHTTLAFTSLFFYILACHTLSKNSSGVGEGYRKKYVMFALMFLAFIVAILRIGIGAHTINDVFAGIILGFLVSLVFKYYDVSGERIDGN